MQTTTAAEKQWDELDGPLFAAAEEGLEWQARQLLASGANANARDGAGFTPLHSAAVHGHFSVFRLLVENGSDIAAKNVRGKTPLDLAELNGQMEIIGYYADKPGLAPPVPVMKTLKLTRK